LATRNPALAEDITREQKGVEDARKRALDPRTHLFAKSLAKTDGLLGQARQ
jgi:hypothetical protein